MKKLHLALLALPALILCLLMVVAPLLGMGIASFQKEEFGVIQPGFTLANYQDIFSRVVYFEVFTKTFLAAGFVTLLCILLGYPVAAHLVSVSPRRRALLYFLISAPLLVNSVVRTYGWLLLLGNKGLVNTLLLDFGLVDSAVRLSGNFTGLIIGGTQVFLPFMILSIATSLQGIDRRLLESSDVLGASPLRSFFRITLPLSAPGIVAGSTLVFSLMLGAFVTPLILGGTAVKYLSVVVYTDALILFNLPRATALALTLLVAIVIVYLAQIMITRKLRAA